MAIRIKSRKNLLDYIPVKNEKYSWKLNEDGLIQISIPRNGLINCLVRTFKSTPLVFIVDLDAVGSFVWRQIDGKRNIYEISNLLKENFGSDIEPVYIRTGQFINLLKNNKLII